MNLNDVAQKYADYQIEMRRWFHQHPEISCHEEKTSLKVQEELTKHGIEWRKCGSDGYGVLATVKGSKPGKTVLLRGDMDALTVKEDTGLPFASEVEGVMHACGHDCHTSELLVAACILNDMKEDLCGEVRLAFQPAEEVAKGAKWMIEDGALDGVDGCFASHVWGGVPAGKFTCQAGPRMGAARQFEVKLIGKSGHGAQPHTCVDAVVMGADLINHYQTLVSRHFSPLDPVVLTVGTVNAGTRFNVIAGDCTMTGTTRCMNPEVFEELPKVMEQVAKDVAASYGGTAEYTDNVLVPVTVNDADFAELARNAGTKVLGDGSAIDVPPTMGGEDFSYFSNKVPGAVMLIGIDNPECNAIYDNHHQKFTVDESVLIKAAMIYAQVAMDFNAQ